MKHVLVMGGGMGGLAVALALENSGYEVLIVERDPAPPSIDPRDAFEHWPRPGVPQFHHSHILLARLHTIVRDRHPDFLAQLRSLGFKPAELGEVLPPTHADSYRESPGDRDLMHLWGRRATFEYVLRQHVGRLPHVRFIHGARVEGLLTDRSDGRLRVTGVELRIGDRREQHSADLVVDATGSRSNSADQLRAAGAAIAVEDHESRYAYVCRHYRLRDPAAEPPRGGTGANLDYLWFGMFHAEGGHFSIALACPIAENALVDLIKRAQGFEQVCRCMPVLERWIESATPLGPVLGARKFRNRWVTYGERGSEVLGFFPVGDSHLHTNPMYGRGCSSAFVQAHELAGVLSATDSPAEQASAYYDRCRELLRSHFDSAVAADRLFQSRASLQRGDPLAVPDRVLNYLYDAAWTPALLGSPLVAREMLKAMQMRELSDAWTRMRMVAHILRAFFGQLLGTRRTEAPRLGPGRDELLQSLGVTEARPLSSEPT